MEMISTKLCLVTVGATASFERLIRQVLNEPFLAQLAKYHYTHLLVQYGKNGEKIWNEFNEKFPPGCEQLQGVTVGGFDFKPDLWRYMRMAVKEQNQDLGIIISHAGMTWNIFFESIKLTHVSGTGTILDALRLALPLIIVPNPDLADNHQEDLAVEMEQMKYAVRADIE
jgi:beta-1,4-N-acetylglucosaminyltransferase